MMNVKNLAIVILAVTLVGVYGEMRYSHGLVRGEYELALERKRLGEEHIAELTRQQYEAHETGLFYEELRTNTENELATHRSTIERLRAQARAASAIDRKWREASGEPHGTRGDWIGGFSACVEEYVNLGGNCARIADKLRGLQEFQERIQK